MVRKLRTLASSESTFVEAIRNSKYFDANWYYSAYFDVRAAGVDPAQHYFLHGARENRNPSQWFSTLDYKRRFPELESSGENPLLHLTRRETRPEHGAKRLLQQSKRPASVPKLFHKVWLSGEAVPRPLQLGGETFSRLHPEFETRCWSLNDLDGDDAAFLREAIEERKWAFATDYVRLKALYEYGGVYADGDVSFYHRLDDYFGFDSVFCWETYFAIGPHFLMAKPNNAVIGRLLDIYKARHLRSEAELDLTPMPVILTWVLATEYGMRIDGSRQRLTGDNLVEQENVFTTNFADGQCVAEHLYYGGWTDEHGGSYKDSLADIARRWEKDYNAPQERRLRALSTPAMQWSYYFLKNAQAAFPAIGERSDLEAFQALKRRRLGGSFVSRAALIEALEPANPLRFVSKWHRKARAAAPLDIAAPLEAPSARELDSAAIAVIQRNSHKISIVVPIYNVEDYLVRCLKSIRAQTHGDFEALLIDDGSTDRSAEIAKAVTQTDSRFRYYRKPNGGLGDARNYAIPLLDSDLVTFVDSDDYLREDHLEKLEAKFRQGHDLAICNMALTMPDGRVIETRDLASFWGEADPVIHALLSTYECYAWNKMYVTESFTANDNARYALGWFEDFALTPALIASAGNLAFVPEPTYNYVQRPDSILATARKKIERNVEIFDSFRMLVRHKAHVPEDYWNVYMEWMAPKHYFYWRIASILREKSYGRRVAAASAFAQKLNAEIPEWFASSYIKNFITEPNDVHKQRQRELLIQAFRGDDLAFYAQARNLADFAL